MHKTNFTASKFVMNTEQRNHLPQELFEHATESIIVIAKSGEIQEVNPATERLFGYNKEELIGKTIECLMPDRLTKRHEQHRENYNHNPHPRSMGIGMDLYAKKKDGTEFPVEISLSPFESGGQKFVIGFVIDITKRKLAEQGILEQKKSLELLAEELKTNNAKLESKVQDRTKVLQEALTEIEKSRADLAEALEKEKELNEMKSRFLSMASHEFRTPLTTILSSASLIPEYPATEQQDKRAKHVDRIKSAVNNMNDILSDFLSLSKIEEGKVVADFKEVNLKTIATEVVNEMKGICKEGQQINYTHSGEEEINNDPKLTRNILINLISNAIKFSDENKEITLTTSSDKNAVTISIKDQGIGISKEDKEHLFERFFRGQNASNIQGTGLGLNIVAKYVELMNGYLEMESELDVGTTFTITFKKNNN
ncbi:MAG: PAS domain-containing sensor histidine kinase [Bacteroidetes bacterium]|nr:PAS domain-containing sensor histidine kinase [Bacteroidota bacterium]